MYAALACLTDGRVRKELDQSFHRECRWFSPTERELHRIVSFQLFFRVCQRSHECARIFTSVHMTPNLPVASTSGISSKDSFQNEQQTVKLNSWETGTILLFVNNTTLGPCRSSWGGGGGRRWGEGRRRWQGGEMTCRSVSSTLRRTQRTRKISAADMDPHQLPRSFFGRARIWHRLQRR